ncbi:MAG: alpha/beta hydrolase-fold protein [Oscillospiraceae bacterium]|nr:alpha/beta hydrolase-fold protein [Oscillospiraceae bacterium]
MDITINEYTGKAFITHGKIVTFDMAMEAYPDKRTRTIRVWLPESYDGKRRFPVFYMHDGQNLFDGLDEPCGFTYGNWRINREMEDLEKDGLPAIIVGVDNGLERFSELCPDIPVNPDFYRVFNITEPLTPTGNLYAEFITSRLKPFVDERFMTLPDAANTAIGGASMGGLISLYMILKYPDIYKMAMVFAPNFVTHTEAELLGGLERYDYTKLKDSRIFIFHGGQDLEAINWPYVRVVYEAMRDKGMDCTHLALLYDSRQPHHELAWQKYYAEAYRFLFHKEKGGTIGE